MKALPTGLSTRSKSLPTRSIFCIRAALDVPLAKLFDYSIPAGMDARVDDRVVVPFGARQRLGVVLEAGVTSELPAARVKPIVALRDDAPRLPADWLELMRFLSGYYQRPLGETVISALPPRLRSVKPLPRKALQSATAPGSARFVPNHSLNAAQTRALDRMASALGSFSAFLLHGVTGSGKTEVYLHLIARVLARGGQALVLVPEISLTPQLEAVFRQAFPETRLALLHSGLEDVARTGSWLDAARGDAGIVLGTRLAVLAPLPKLALGPLRAPRAGRARCAGRPIAGGSHGRLAAGLPAARSGGIALGRNRSTAQKERTKPGVHQSARLCAGARLRGLRLDCGLRSLHRAHGGACGGPRAALPPLRRRERHSARLPHLRQRRPEADGPRHAARRRDAGRGVSRRAHRAYRPRQRAAPRRTLPHAAGHRARRSRYPGRHAAARQRPRFPRPHSRRGL